jgi:hypothetical protein
MVIWNSSVLIANWERVAVRVSVLYATVYDSCCNIGVAGCRHCTQSLQFVAERECCPSRSVSNLCSTIFISRYCYKCSISRYIAISVSYQ